MSLTFTENAWFHTHSSDVHEGLLYPSLHAVSTLNRIAATWLHTSPLLEFYVGHQINKDKFTNRITLIQPCMYNVLSPPIQCLFELLPKLQACVHHLGTSDSDWPLPISCLQYCACASTANTYNNANLLSLTVCVVHHQPTVRLLESRDQVLL